MCLYIWEIWQTKNEHPEVCIKAVAIAANEQEARHMYPFGGDWDSQNALWVNPDDVLVELLGVAAAYSKPGIVLAVNHYNLPF